MSDEELRKYSYAIQWLMSPNTEKHQHNPFFKIFKKIGGEKRFLNPIAFLFKKRDSSEFDRFPSHVLLLWYGIISYQVFIPFNSDNFHFATLKKLVFPLEEHILLKKYENGGLSEIGIDRDQLSSMKKTRKKKDKLSFGFRMNPDFKGFKGINIQFL
ncbi:MAG: hypothetical protein CMC35_09685 [Flavobacteriaceae bacterium]|nr:hypothetical protein [Flavobacteriaceae bacterium]|tara:strand:- start:2805 stop:3275 length:471 start_codon:yes stop_codon:yes gene_type:complete